MNVDIFFVVINALLILFVGSLSPLGVVSYIIYADKIRLILDVVDGFVVLILTITMLICAYFVLKKNHRGTCVVFIILGIICGFNFLQRFGYKLAHTLPLTRDNLQFAFEKGNLTITELTFNCCGLRGHKDYEKYKLPVPSSCCSKPSTHPCETEELKNVPGCYKATEMYVIIQIAQMAIFLVLFVLESIAISLALYILRQITKGAQTTK